LIYQVVEVQVVQERLTEKESEGIDLMEVKGE